MNMNEKNFYPIQMVLEGKEYDLQYQEELKISQEVINENLKDQSNLYAFYAVLEEVAEAIMAEAKLTLEVTEATLDAKYRKELSGGKVTENLLRNSIVLDEDYLNAISAFNEARKNVGLLKAIRESFNHRKDMLVTLASNMRIQMADSSIFVNKIKQENLVKR